MPAFLRPPFGIWTNTLIAVAVVSGIPLLVTLFMASQEAALRRWLPHLTAFGAGAVFGAAVAHLIPESIRSGQPPLAVATGLIVGYLVFALIERALASHDHAHAHGIALGAPSAHDSDTSEAECVHVHPTPSTVTPAARAKSLAPMAFLGDALHNFVDGSLIAAGFLADPSIGILTVIAVGLHELPREVGTFGLFVHGGIRPMRAVLYNLVTAGIAMLAASITLLVGQRLATLTTLLLPVAAGTYLYIALVVGKSALHDRHHDPAHWARLGWSAVGAAIMIAFALA